MTFSIGNHLSPKIIAPARLPNVYLLLIAIGAAVVGSYIFYRLVEQPFMRLAARQR